MAWATTQGWREGWTFHMRDHRKLGPSNPHIIFMVDRLIVYAVAVFFALPFTWCISLALSVLLVMMFPFLHDGMYYDTRNDYSSGKVYPDGWSSNPDTNNELYDAKISLNFKSRLALFLFGIIGFVASVLAISI